MKKVLVLLGVFSLVSAASFGAVQSKDVSSIESLKNQGYSTSALRAIDAAYSHKVDGDKYVNYFSPKKRNFFGNVYTHIKLYVDPIQEDDRFTNRDIEYTNTWLGNDTFYTSKKRPVSNL